MVKWLLFTLRKEGFARCFWSQGGDYREYHEKPFKVIRRTEEKDGFDMECLPDGKYSLKMEWW